MRNEAKKIIIIAILVIIGFLLQTSVFPFLPLFGAVPNIILLLVVSIAVMNGSISAMIVGFVCGLFLDAMYGATLGVYALFYMLVGYVNGYFHVLFFAEASFLPLVLVFVNDIVYHIATYLVFFVPRQKWNFLFYLKKIIIPELLYTTLISVVLYQVFFNIYQLAKRKKKKRRSRHVF